MPAPKHTVLEAPYRLLLQPNIRYLGNTHQGPVV